MAKFRKRPVVIEALTFDEFTEQGKRLAENLVDGKPWSFKFNGHVVTNETDDHYIINTLEGNMDFKREDMLIIGIEGEIYPCKIGVFNKTYEPYPPTYHDVEKYYEDEEPTGDPLPPCS